MKLNKTEKGYRIWWFGTLLNSGYRQPQDNCCNECLCKRRHGECEEVIPRFLLLTLAAFAMPLLT